MNKDKKFDCVKMTRSIREKLYEEHKDLNKVEYLKLLSEEAKKSSLYGKQEYPLGVSDKKKK